jgi:glycosyltransferase involved in cell wall biosynthesis
VVALSNSDKQPLPDEIVSSEGRMTTISVNGAPEARDTRHGPSIVMVVPGLGPGGSEGVVSFIASIWAARGWRITIVTFEGAANAVYYPVDPRVDTRFLGLPMARVALPLAAYTTSQRVIRLRRQIQHLAPDLVISFLTRTNVLTLLSTWGLSIPVIVSERNNPRIQTVGKTWSWLRRRLYPRAFGLITMTNGAMELFPPDMRVRGWVIPNQINLPSGVERKSGLKTIVGVGRLVPQKGFDLLIAAFHQIAGTHPDWRLIIWGDGPERNALLNLRDKLGLQDRVSLPGVSRRPAQWIETAEVFALSSRHEGWGIVLMEAMAAGLAVTAFDCDFGPREMITHEEDGLLLPNGDVDALAATLARLVEDSTLRQKLGEAAAISSKRFASDRIMELWDEVIGTALPARQ